MSSRKEKKTKLEKLLEFAASVGNLLQETYLFKSIAENAVSLNLAKDTLGVNKKD
jgi:hypothetical protein